MPVQKNPFARHRQIGSERMSSRQVGPGTSFGQEPSSPEEIDTPSDGANSQAQPQQKRLNLITPPADHRYLKGRY